MSDWMCLDRAGRPWTRIVRVAAVAVALGGAGVHDAAMAQSATTGLGSYRTELKRGDPVPPVAEFVTGAALGKAAPTNQWYSSVMFQRWSQPIHALPMTYRATEGGFELGLPVKRVATVDGSREVKYAHTPAIVVSPTGFKPQDARLAKFSDWLAQISMAGSDGAALTATVLHGNPFSYYEVSSGDVRLRLAARPDAARVPTDGTGDGRVAVLTVAGRPYAVFAPSGARWEWAQPTELVLRLPADARYFSIAGLPDASEATVEAFARVAYAFPTETRVEWSYDERASKVRSTFRVKTVAKEGDNLATLMGLYPHHWSALASPAESKHGYDSVRGRIRLVEGNSFTVERPFYGVLPAWGPLQDPSSKDAVASLLVGDEAKSGQLFTRMGRGTYWVGKGLGATAQLMSVAEAEGDLKKRDKLLGTLKERLESWFDGKHGTYFAHDARIGSFLGVPQEYSSISNMNDHHFHYGYWVMAAAHVALRDPEWASEQKWGGMVGKIIADIATDERGRTDFPFLRNFDPYEGHSWASGDANFDDGNNQESSSEAVNAWAGLALWGEATGNERLRDLGIYLLTSEIASVNQYWFDLDRQVLDPEFGKPFASMVFGGKYSYNTWWTQEPRQILGINMLPITPASTYLGADPAYIRRVVEALPAEVKAYRGRGLDDGTPSDIWQDVIASYAALADADFGASLWNRKGSVEGGETRSHTLYWLSSLKEMGQPDFSVTADTPLYAVFKDASGKRTYLAYNARSTPIRVTFSSGQTLDVPARSLARSP
jgi:endoglucanase Acf2